MSGKFQYSGMERIQVSKEARESELLMRELPLLEEVRKYLHFLTAISEPDRKEEMESNFDRLAVNYIPLASLKGTV